LILRITDKIEADMKLQNEVDKVPKWVIYYFHSWND
jgi:hypothetical protein